MFFVSSSGSERSGRPSDSLLELEDMVSLLREPYLFLRYLAQEERAAPSFSPGAVPLLLASPLLELADGSGLASLDLMAWLDLDLASDVPGPYLLAR